MLPQLTPLRLAVARAPFDHPDWLFELKYDGWRALAYLEKGHVRLISRNGRVYRRFDDLCASLATTISAREAILDGEIVCLDADGRPRFNDLFHRRGTPSFVAFDLLWLNGIDYRPKPLLNRTSALSTIVPATSDCLLHADHVLERGVDFFKLVCERDLEGVVAKLTQAPYAEIKGKTPWFKIKNPHYSQGAGRQEQFQRRP